MGEQKKSSKTGRNLNDCKAYALSQKHDISHGRRVYRHLKRIGFTDAKAIAYFHALPMSVRRIVTGSLENLKLVPTSHAETPPTRPMPRGRGCAPTPRMTRAA